MKAIVRSVYSSDVDVNSYISMEPDADGIWVRFIIGPDNGPGEESFDVLVCTPLWLREVIEADGPQIGRHRLIVGTLDLPDAIRFLRSRFEACEAADWPALAEKLGRIGYWEFEDYRP